MKPGLPLGMGMGVALDNPAPATGVGAEMPSGSKKSGKKE